MLNTQPMALFNHEGNKVSLEQGKVLQLLNSFKLLNCESYKGDKEKIAPKNNMGLAIAMGGGIGLIFDLFFFDGVGIGISIGAGVGIALASFNKR